MAINNPKFKNLIPQTPNWNHLPTKALRVPECFLEEIKAYAHALDQNATSPIDGIQA